MKGYYHPPKEPHPVGSRIYGSGFEYYCYSCDFLARAAGGVYTVIHPGKPGKHKVRAGDEEGRKLAGPKPKRK